MMALVLLHGSSSPGDEARWQAVEPNSDHSPGDPCLSRLLLLQYADIPFLFYHSAVSSCLWFASWSLCPLPRSLNGDGWGVKMIVPSDHHQYFYTNVFYIYLSFKLPSSAAAASDSPWTSMALELTKCGTTSKKEKEKTFSKIDHKNHEWQQKMVCMHVNNKCSYVNQHHWLWCVLLY